MSYNGSGTFSVLSTFVTNSTISSSAMNALLADIASGLSSCIVKDGQQSVTGAIRFASGSVSSPGISFGSDTDCGLYRIGADNIGVAIGGSKIMDLSSTGAADANGNAYTAFPSGTLMLFQQTSAPTGWTKQTTHNDKALRVVSGTASSGGTSAFSTVFGLTSTNSYTLTSTDIPAHTHSFSATSGSESASHTHTGTTETESASHSHSGVVTGAATVGTTAADTSTNPVVRTLTTGSTSVPNITHTHAFTTSANSAGHTHSVSGTTGSTGSSGGHSHAIELRVQYVDLIIAAKA